MTRFMYRNPKFPPWRGGSGLKQGYGLISSLCRIQGLESVSDHHPFASYESLDDIIVGVLVALVVFAYERRRYLGVVNKLRMISAMNHHVRNALQAISYAPYTEQEQQIKVIRESVARIQWALCEVLPGERNEEQPLAPVPGAIADHDP